MLKVLVVDDELLQRQFLNQLIDWESHGMQVVAEAETGIEAIQLCERHRPDIVVMDINIPRMNGIETSKNIKSRFPSCQIIILTAYGEFEYAKEALEIGVVGYVLKPLDPAIFVKELKKAQSEIEKEKSRFAYVEQAQIIRELAGHRDELFSILRMNDSAGLTRKIEKLFGGIEETGPTRELAVFTSVNLLLLYTEYLEERGAKAKTFHLEKDDLFKRLNGCGSLTEIKRAVTEFLCIHLEKVSALAKPPAAKKVEEAKRYIETHYGRSDLDLTQIAESVGLNASYLSNIFKNDGGTSLSSYILTVRMKKAKELIDSDPKSTLAVLAEKVGYSDSYYFSKSFKNYYGVTPTQYMGRK
ncbi:response regulator transcription factor [Cohnella cellulosilytica]|uniref:Response regulator n=1 Tax=Cohnella cellulosilytica TaxID=986710 RepID=A0ABW2FCT0_9BACL